MTMMIAIGNGMYLSTSKVDAEERFDGGKFRDATAEERVCDLRAISPSEIGKNPLSFQALAIAIARLDAYVGKGAW
jgi:hypothetical protein